MSFLNGPEFVRQPMAPTTQRDAWKDRYYETYLTNVTLHAVRLHAKFHRRLGNWFGVDRYGDTVSKYRKAMALINPAEVAESYVLPEGGVFNVGVVNEQGALKGGGWQFEYVRGSQPLHDEHMPDLKGSSRVPL